MTWVKRVHRCKKPTDEAYTGDIWKCDECGKHWLRTLIGWTQIGTPR